MSFLQRIFGISQTKTILDTSAYELADGKIIVDLSAAPELSADNGAVRLESRKLEKRILLFKGDDGQYHAFHNRCSCSGFRLDPQVRTNSVKCATLGQSTFDYNGKPLSKHNDKPVQVFEVNLVDPDKLEIKLD